MGGVPPADSTERTRTMDHQLIPSELYSARWHRPAASRSTKSMRNSTRDSLDQKLLEQGPHRTRARTDQRVPDRQLRSLPIARRIVQIRNSRRRQITHHIGVDRLPAPVISLTDDHARDSMQRP